MIGLGLSKQRLTEEEGAQGLMIAERYIRMAHSKSSNNRDNEKNNGSGVE